MFWPDFQSPFWVDFDFSSFFFPEGLFLNLRCSQHSMTYKGTEISLKVLPLAPKLNKNWIKVARNSQKLNKNRSGQPKVE